jgi:phosphate uptake regulator
VAVSETFVLKESGLMSPRECLGYRLITKSMERTADHAVNVSTNSLTLTLANLSEEVIGALNALSDSAISVFEDAIESLFKEDYSIADNVLKGAEKTKGMEGEIVQKIIKSAQPEDIPALRLIIESIIRTAEYGADIAEVVLNMTIQDEIQED